MDTINNIGIIKPSIFKYFESIDKIARDRSTFHEYDAVAPLLCFESCRKRGCSWIGVAESFCRVDDAVKRGGRMDHFIFCRPSINDSKEVWEKYVKDVKDSRFENLKQLLLDDATEKMKNLV